MEPIIQRIYETGQVVGRSGKAYQVHSAIDLHEGEFLVDIIRHDSGVARTLEIGCAFGLSSLYICTATRERVGASHTIIDPYENRDWDGCGTKNLEEAGIGFFELIEEKSELALPRLLERNEEQFDLAFIDGFHTFDHTLVDCFYATRLLRVGGYLVVDDVAFPSVRRVVNFLKNYPCYRDIGSVGRERTEGQKTLARKFGSLASGQAWTKVLPRRFHRKIFLDESVSMIGLKKVSRDARKWDWHDDRF